MGFQTHISLSTGGYDFSDAYDKFKSGVLTIGISISCIVALICWIAFHTTGIWKEYTTDIFVSLVLYSFFFYIMDFARISYIYEKKAKLNFVIATTLALSKVFLSFALLRFTGAGEAYMSRVYGESIPYCVIGGLFIITVLRGNFSFPSLHYWKYSLSLGIPMIFHVLSGRVLSQSDCIMLEKMGNNLEAVGIYSFFFSFSNVLTAILTALNASWVPFLFDYFNKQDMDEIKKGAKNYIEVFSTLCIVFVLLSREICLMFSGEEYIEGVNLIPLFTSSVYFIFMYQFSINYETYIKRTDIIALGTFASAMLNILLNIVLIPSFGMCGAAIGTCLAYFFLFLAHYYLTKRMQNGNQYVSMADFSRCFSLYVFSCIAFYVFDFARPFRWGIAIYLCAYLGNMILARRSIF